MALAVFAYANSLQSEIAKYYDDAVVSSGCFNPASGRAGPGQPRNGEKGVFEMHCFALAQWLGLLAWSGIARKKTPPLQSPTRRMA